MTADLQQLIEKWRKEADDEDVRLRQYCYGRPLDGDMLDEDITVGFVRSAERRQCADDLAALLAAGRALEPQEPEKDSARVDGSTQLAGPRATASTD